MRKAYLLNVLLFTVPTDSVEELFNLCADESGDGTSASCGDDEDVLVSGSVTKEGAY